MNMNFDNIKNIENEKINKILTGLCSENTELYLVGGYIRDLILEKACYDRDYVIKGEKATIFAKKVANSLNGYYVLLDEEFDIARVVLSDKKYTLDFAGCVKQDIYEDLKRRDYTINSIAYKINCHEARLIDPFNSIADIENKIIKAISKVNLIDDPLRLLRAFRQAAQLNFRIEKETFDYIKNLKTLINQISVERINTELIKLFEANYSAFNLNLMKETEILDEIFPEISPQRKIPQNVYHHLVLIDHSIETVRQIEINIHNLPEWAIERINSNLTPNIKIISLLKIAAFLHDIGKPSTWQIDELGRHRFIKHADIGAELAVALLKRLKFSKNSIKYITKLIKYHLYPSQLLGEDKDISEKAILRMFRKIENETPELILLAIADRLSAKGAEITQEIIDTNIKKLHWLLDKYKESLEKIIFIPKLLSGNEIMKILNIPEGPKVGKIVKALKEAQISGDINTKEEAVGFIVDLYH
ncbi:MAG: HD domain-containing protein [bacterium]